LPCRFTTLLGRAAGLGRRPYKKRESRRGTMRLKIDGVTRAIAPLAAVVLLTIAAVGTSGQDIKIAYEKFALSNGLTVIVHEDHKAPIVALNIWYHVGSKNEK